MWEWDRKICPSAFANNTNTDQPAHLRSLMRSFIIHLLESSHKWIFIFLASRSLLFEFPFVRNPEDRFKPSSKIFLLTGARRCFFWGSFMLFLSWFCFAFVRVCLLMPCVQLLGKDWPLGSRLWCLILNLSLSHWYPGSGERLIVSIPDLCSLSYFVAPRSNYFRM